MLVLIGLAILVLGVWMYLKGEQKFADKTKKELREKQREADLLAEQTKKEQSAKQLEADQHNAEWFKNHLAEKLEQHKYHLYQEMKRCTTYDAYDQEESAWLD